MKKLIILSALALGFAMLATTSFASDKEVTVPQVTDGSIVIDGIMDDAYKGCTAQTMTEQNLDYFSSSLEDSWGTFYVVHDSGFVYLFADIYDDDIDYLNPDPSQTWNRESIGVMMDFSYNRESEYLYSYDNGDEVCYVNLSGDGTLVTYHMYAPKCATGLFDKIVYATITPESGSGHIYYEIAMPIPESIMITDGGKFGLEVLATEATCGSRLGCVSWSEAGSEMWHYSDVLGTAYWNTGSSTPTGTLPEEPAAEEADTTEVIETVAEEFTESAEAVIEESAAEAVSETVEETAEEAVTAEDTGAEEVTETADAVESTEKSGSPAGIIVGIAAAVIVIGGAAAYFIISKKKK